MGRKSDYWSYKLNRPGRRFLCFFDGKGQARKIFGSFSAKWHDAEYLKTQKSWLERHFDGATVIGDQHFEPLKHFFPNITIREPPTKKRGKVVNGKRLSKLTKTQDAYNKKVKKVRARVERPFAWIKKKFNPFKTYWSESEDQLDCALWCYNMRHG